MNDETEKIFKEQLEKLPKEVVDFIFSSSWDTDLGEIADLYSLSEKETSIFSREATFVLAGLIHPDEFSFVLEGLGFKGAVLENLVANVEKKIFTPIRPALIAFFEKEAVESKDKAGVTPAAQPAMSWVITPNKMTAKTTPAPENIPTPDTAESFLPKLIPKVPLVPTPTTPTIHPFEDKLRQSFTAGEAPAPTVSVETPAPIVPAPPKVFTPTAPVAPAVPTPQTYVTPKPEAPGVYKVDPYREAI